MSAIAGRIKSIVELAYSRIKGIQVWPKTLQKFLWNFYEVVVKSNFQQHSFVQFWNRLESLQFSKMLYAFTEEIYYYSELYFQEISFWIYKIANGLYEFVMLRSFFLSKPCGFSMTKKNH